MAQRVPGSEPGEEHGEQEGAGGMGEEPAWRRKLMTAFLVAVAVVTFASAAMILFG